GDADRELVKDALGARALARQAEVRAGEADRVTRGDAAARVVPLVEAAQLDAQDGGLQRVEARVAAVGERVLVLRNVAVVGDQARLAGDLLVVGRDGAGGAGGAEIFGRIERKTRRLADAADAAPRAVDLAAGAVRLCGVLDQREAVLVAQREQ